MTIDEAIEILEDIPRYDVLREDSYEYGAVRLAIEALKFIQIYDKSSCFPSRSRLPGEEEVKP